MAELKTKVNDASVDTFIQSVRDETTRADCYKIIEIMRKVANAEPRMWGASIVGFGSYRYSYASGREGDWMLVGFSPRKQNLTLYIMSGFDEYDSLLKKLGKHTTGKSCLYIKRLADVDMKVLRELITKSVKHMQKVNARATA